MHDLLRPARAEAGGHAPAGIVVLVGPEIAPRELGPVSQLDVTPTILAWLGLPVAEDMAGAAWVEESTDRVPSHDHLAGVFDELRRLSPRLLIFNYPNSPRKLDITARKLRELAGYYLKGYTLEHTYYGSGTLTVATEKITMPRREK